jgi:predicted enzyme related to lactoylglutathione lyase
MGERTSYEPGTFCWVDLATTDPGGAEAFYTGLFGWEAHDMSGEFGVYTMLRLGGRDACGLYAMPEEARAAGWPPYWTSYVAVGDTDAAAERAASLGANIVAIFDIPPSGRMAIVQDPQGAAFGLWQSGEHIGAGVVNEPGAFTLNQLNTTDPDAAGRFYAGLFGWEVAQVGTDPVPYWGLSNRGRLNGGMMELQPGDPSPPHWLVYFTTADLDRTVEAIGGGGGAVVVTPMDVPGGRIAVARDPQGGHFAIFEGRVDP